MSDVNTSVDIFNYYNNQKTTGVYQPARVPIPTSDVGHKSTTVLPDSDEANNTLSFEDMLLLMVTQLQNQTIDNTADTNDMMNQIIQMTVMQQGGGYDRGEHPQLYRLAGRPDRDPACVRQGGQAGG